MSKILVIDANSLLDFNKFYVFDKAHDNKVYSKLMDFLLDKIKTGEIIILDKVFDEIHSNKYTNDLKTMIKPHIVNTNFLIPEIGRLINENKVDENISIKGYSEVEIERLLNLYEKKHADLFLIAYCNNLKLDKKYPLLVTEETFNDDGKILNKIPTICKKEKIQCIKIPQALFNHYKDEIQFSLSIS